MPFHKRKSFNHSNNLFNLTLEQYAKKIKLSYFAYQEQLKNGGFKEDYKIIGNRKFFQKPSEKYLNKRTINGKIYKSITEACKDGLKELLLKKD